nr:MAG TPA: antirestriction protein [Caudoviricetes sp.]
MARYEYNKDYPFAVYVTNLGKYNEGMLVGEWVHLPTTAKEMKEVFERIGIGQKDDFGCPYEEWFITDYDCYVTGLCRWLGKYENLDELNYLAARLDEMSNYDLELFEAVIEIGDCGDSVKDLINLMDNLDNYMVFSGVTNDYDLGYYYIEESGCYDTDKLGTLGRYIDYEAFGRDVRYEEGGCFTSAGYISHDGSSFTEYYEGAEDIPDEYRVMTFEEEEDE